jgi:hypothetical protein
MKTKSGLAFEFVTTSNQDINSLDSMLKKLIAG